MPAYIAILAAAVVALAALGFLAARITRRVRINLMIRRLDAMRADYRRKRERLDYRRTRNSPFPYVEE